MKIKSIAKTMPGIFFICLIVPYLGAAVSPSDYTDPKICAGCHAEIYSQWNGSMHSNAHIDPVYEKLFIMASMETNGTFDEFCTSCHAPIDFLSGMIPSASNYNVSPISEKGVSCDFCHTVNGSKGTGNAAFNSSPGKIKYGPFNDSDYSTYHSTTYSELHTKGEFCGMCHDVKHPFNGLALENTYTEWKEGPYNETTPCQHCHMTPGVTKFETNPGRAALGGPIREHIFTHYIVGGNAMMTGLLGSPEHEKLARERLHAAANVEILDLQTKNDTVEFNVKVTNAGAGHYLPTGLTEARLMWLDVEVRDSLGNTIFRSGERDADGYVDHDAVLYHTVFGDSDGKPTEKVWYAEQILSDKRIPPKGYSLERFEFIIPGNARGPLNLEVRLNYISATQELSDLLFGKGQVISPTIEMTAANTTIDIPASKEETPKQTPGFSLLLAVTFLLYAVKQYRNNLKR